MLKMSVLLAILPRAVLGKVPAEMLPQGLTRIGINSRSRANIVPVVPPKQFTRCPFPPLTFPVEILVSHCHPNDSRGIVCFPVGFRSHAVSPWNYRSPKCRGNKTINESRRNISRATRVHGIAARERRVRHMTGIRNLVYMLRTIVLVYKHFLWVFLIINI